MVLQNAFMMMRRSGFALLMPLLLLALGCSGTANVSGSVTYDGKAVERGRIRFLPLDEKGELDAKGLIVGADVIKGKYTAVDVPMGKKKVAILALEIAGQTPATNGKAAQTSEPPVALEAMNELQVDINAARQTADFDLKKPNQAAGERARK